VFKKVKVKKKKIVLYAPQYYAAKIHISKQH